MIYELKLHPRQFEVWEDLHRFKVICAGRRWGKSTLALISSLFVLGSKKNAIVAIVGPTYQQVKDIYWRDPNKISALIPYEAIEKKNDSELFIQLKGTNSFLYLRGSDRPDTLRGIRYDFVVLDEYASMKPNVWEEIIQPSLLDSGGQAIFISTPKGYNHFYELFSKQDPEWKSWKFTSYDNPYLDKKIIEQARRDTDEDTFAQEYLAEFKKFTGLVYKDFSREKHIIDPIELKDEWSYYRAIDFGYVNPTAVLFLAVDNKGVIYVYDEIYQTGLQTPDLANLIKQKSPGRHFTLTVADSSQISDIEELRRYGFSIQPVSKTSGGLEDWTTYRIRKVAEKLKNKKLLIFKNCKNLVYEFENYRYHEVREGAETKERPMKVNDHLLDALSYLIVSLPEWVEPSFADDYQFEKELPEEKLFNQDGFY